MDNEKNNVPASDQELSDAQTTADVEEQILMEAEKEAETQPEPEQQALNDLSEKTAAKGKTDVKQEPKTQDQKTVTPDLPPVHEEMPVPPKQPRAKIVWNRRTISVCICFVMAILLYAGSIIGGIVTAVRPVVQESLYERDHGGQFLPFDFDDDFDGFDRFDFESYSQTSLQPAKSGGNISYGQKDYVPVFGSAICGTLFVCTGLILLNQKDHSDRL